MQHTLIVAAIAALAAACTPSKDATPSRDERVVCEARCFAERGTCRASDFDCDRIEAICKQACRYWE